MFSWSLLLLLLSVASKTCCNSFNISFTVGDNCTPNVSNNSANGSFYILKSYHQNNCLENEKYCYLVESEYNFSQNV